MADGEDIYDVAPTSTETVKDFSKLIGRFDQKPRPGSVYPGKGVTQSKRPVLAPVQLPPKKGPMGPLSPAAIVSPQLVNSVRKQLSVVPNKRASAMAEGAVNPTRPTSQAGEAAPPVIPSKKAAPPPIAEAPEPSPTQSETQSAIDQRPPKAVPVMNVRPISTRISQVVPGSPTDQHSNDKLSRASKVSTGYDNVPPAPMNYKQLSLPPMDGPPPPKPSKPPHVELPSLEDVLSDDIYDDVCQRGSNISHVSMISEIPEDEDADPPLPRRQSKEKAGQSTRRKPPPIEDNQDVYDEVQ